MEKINLFLSINEACNLDCRYCNVFKTKKALSFEDCKRAFIYFLKFFPNAPGYNLVFMGGEPLLSASDIEKMIIFLRVFSKKLGKEITTYMPTNGTMLTRAHLDFYRLYQHKLSISIDSIDPAYHERNIRGSDVSSVSVLLDRLVLFKEYRDIIRVKMVVTPENTGQMITNFDDIQSLGFNFINIQPAHGVFWSDEAIEEYIRSFSLIQSRMQKNLEFKSATLKGSETFDKKKQSSCAKGRNEICIDAYGDVYVCDAFISFEPEKRKQYAHDNIYEPNFSKQKFERYRDWKYCNNTVMGSDTDLTKCKKCEETKSCSTLCNALPINGRDYDEAVLLSNFKLYHQLDLLGS